MPLSIDVMLSLIEAMLLIAEANALEKALCCSGVIVGTDELLLDEIELDELEVTEEVELEDLDEDDDFLTTGLGTTGLMIFFWMPGALVTHVPMLPSLVEHL